MSFRSHVGLFGKLQFSAFAALAIFALSISACTPVEGAFPQLLTPVPQPDPTETSESAVREEVTLDAITAVNALRVRQTASADSPIIAGLIQGDPISVIGRTEDGIWLRVRVPDILTIGWIWAGDVTLSGNAATLLVYDGLEIAEDLPGDSEAAASEEPAGDEEPAAPAAEAAAEPAADENGSQDSADTPASAASEEQGDADALEPAILVQGQDVIKGKVLVDQVVAQVDGWIVIHADDAGSIGPIIGQASLDAGVSDEISVAIDVDAATTTLYAMLHRDGGVFDVFEFPGSDLPILEGGEPISASFDVVIGEMSTAEEGEAGATEAVVIEPEPTEAPLLVQGDVTNHLAIVTTRALRVRSKPETIAEVLASVAVGEAYPVAGFSANEEWVAIFFYGIEDPVWVSASLVELRDIELEIRMGRVAIAMPRGNRLRLRGGPSLAAPVLGHVIGGERHDVLGVSVDGEWALLVGTGVEGATWAATGFLAFD